MPDEERTNDHLRQLALRGMDPATSGWIDKLGQGRSDRPGCLGHRVEAHQNAATSRRESGWCLTWAVSAAPPLCLPLLPALAPCRLCSLPVARAVQAMTNWEGHLTDAAHENSMIVKRSLFRFVNSYSRLFYQGFWQRCAPVQACGRGDGNRISVSERGGGGYFLGARIPLAALCYLQAFDIRVSFC